MGFSWKTNLRISQEIINFRLSWNSVLRKLLWISLQPGSSVKVNLFQLINYLNLINNFPTSTNFKLLCWRINKYKNKEKNILICFVITKILVLITVCIIYKFTSCKGNLCVISLMNKGANLKEQKWMWTPTPHTQYPLHLMVQSLVFFDDWTCLMKVFLFLLTQMHSLLNGASAQYWKVWKLIQIKTEISQWMNLLLFVWKFCLLLLKKSGILN